MGWAGVSVAMLDKLYGLLTMGGGWQRINGNIVSRRFGIVKGSICVL